MINELLFVGILGLLFFIWMAILDNKPYCDEYTGGGEYY
jgi:hypothetical protein